jgi:hypothetical protein
MLLADAATGRATQMGLVLAQSLPVLSSHFEK